MKVHRFVLFNADDVLVMSTEVDEPDPSIDMEFWEQFLGGDCYMQYLGEFDEEEV